jgi:hypothetical protein
MTKTLRNVLPKAEYETYLACCKKSPDTEKMLDVEVVFEHYSFLNSEPERVKPWPGTQKYVHVWWELANGYGVGWNENSSRCHGFPVMKLK